VGEATYAQTIHLGDEIHLGAGQRFRVIDVVRFAERMNRSSDYFRSSPPKLPARARKRSRGTARGWTGHTARETGASVGGLAAESASRKERAGQGVKGPRPAHALRFGPGLANLRETHQRRGDGANTPRDFFWPGPV
jgi:hypothetical protein